MPYKISGISHPAAPGQPGADAVGGQDLPLHQIAIWPYRSLPRTGFVWFIGCTAALISLPLFTLIGSPVLWGLLPFLMLAVAAIWWALERNYSDGDITECLTIWPDKMTLVRQGPRNKQARWDANPYWVTPVLHANDGPVPNYITLRGGDREVELGAFLSEPERVALFNDTRDIMRGLH